jgi:hypothetical protein
MGWALHAGVLGSFACWCSAHAVLCWFLLVRRWHRGLIALLVFPLAPVFGFAEGLRSASRVWLALALVYAVLLVAAHV